MAELSQQDFFLSLNMAQQFAMYVPFSYTSRFFSTLWPHNVSRDRPDDGATSGTPDDRVKE